MHTSIAVTECRYVVQNFKWINPTFKCKLKLQNFWLKDHAFKLNYLKWPCHITVELRCWINFSFNFMHRNAKSYFRNIE